jgi:hypothetical protein
VHAVSLVSVVACLVEHYDFVCEGFVEVHALVMVQGLDCLLISDEASRTQNNT